MLFIILFLTAGAMEGIEQYFAGGCLLCCWPFRFPEQYIYSALYKVVLTFESVDEISSVTIQMKATEQYFPGVLFIMLYKVVLNFWVWMKS